MEREDRESHLNRQKSNGKRGREKRKTVIGER